MVGLDIVNFAVRVEGTTVVFDVLSLISYPLSMDRGLRRRARTPAELQLYGLSTATGAADVIAIVARIVKIVLELKSIFKM